MSSRKKNNSPSAYPKAASIAFFPVVTLIFILWMLYRSLFAFPVWFDESIGKALFFGVPVWLFVTMTRNKEIVDSFAPGRLYKGLLLGVAIGGVFGFVAAILSVFSKGTLLQATPLFAAPEFWGEFVLAICTAFWETLVFYSFAMTMIRAKYPKWSLTKQAVLTSIIFVLFHIPNTFLRFEIGAVSGVIFLLFLFAFGQAYLFAARKNAYALVLSHAIWGLVLLSYGW
jgi:gas vesicle protein